MKKNSNFYQMGLAVVLFLGLVGLGAALFELFASTSGTTETAGAILVTVSTALLTFAAALLLFTRLPDWLGWLFLVLLLIDAVATAVVGFFLMANLLVAAMIGCFVAGFFAAVLGRRNAA